MPLGNGYFYDRKKKKLIDIYEHATDVINRWETFRAKKVSKLNPVTDRDAIVIYVLRQGFIRIRLWNGQLGWQFWGNEPLARKVLHWFARKAEIGKYCVVTYTDFKAKKSQTLQYKDIKK